MPQLCQLLAAAATVTRRERYRFLPALPACGLAPSGATTLSSHAEKPPMRASAMASSLVSCNMESTRHRPHQKSLRTQSQKPVISGDPHCGSRRPTAIAVAAWTCRKVIVVERGHFVSPSVVDVVIVARNQSMSSIIFVLRYQPTNLTPSLNADARKTARRLAGVRSFSVLRWPSRPGP